MQDLRTIPGGPAPTYQDPLYLEDQVPRHRPPIGEWAEDLKLCSPERGMVSSPGGGGKAWLQSAPSPQTVNASFASWLLFLHTGYRAGGLRDSDTDNECWSDTEVVPTTSRRKAAGPQPSLRVIKEEASGREVGGERARGRGCPYSYRSPDCSQCACLLSPNRAPAAP